MSETEQQALPPDTGAELPAPPGEVSSPAEAAQHEEEGRRAKRIAQLTARLASTARERDEMAQRLARLEQMQQSANGQSPVDANVQEQIRQEAQRIAAAEAFEAKKQAFHRAGEETYPDWQERCTNLMAMGADTQLAALLVEIEDGPKIAAALADEPEELERIAALRTERGRAVALGQFAARVASKPVRAVSRAPAPPKTVEARANPKYSEYTESDASKLARYYAQQQIERYNATLKGR